jgi:hypothetical protein
MATRPVPIDPPQQRPLCCFQNTCQYIGGAGTHCSGEDSLYCCEGYTCDESTPGSGICQPG